MQLRFFSQFSIYFHVKHFIIIIYLFKGLWNSPKGGPPPAAVLEILTIVTAKLEYRAMRNGLCTLHYLTTQNEQVVAN